MWQSINSNGWYICGAWSDHTAGPGNKGRQAMRIAIRQAPGKELPLVWPAQRIEAKEKKKKEKEKIRKQQQNIFCSSTLCYLKQEPVLFLTDPVDHECTSSWNV